MKTISIDIETFAATDLKKCGVYKYIEAQDFEILLFGYSVDGGMVQVVDFTAGETLPPDILDALTDSKVQKWAFNANFERICLSHFILQSKYFPAEEYVTIKITNTNSSPLDNPYLTVSGDFVTKAEFFEDLDGTFKDTHTAHAYTGFYDSIAWQKNPSLAPDTTQTFEIPLRKFIIEDVYKANVGLIFHFGFESATSERIDHMVWLKFRDFPNSNSPF